MAKILVCTYFLLLVVNIGQNKNIVSNQNLGDQHFSDFTRYNLVQPKIYHGREKRHISSTLQENGQHLDHIQITLEIDGKHRILDLVLNKQLIPKGFFHRHQDNRKSKVENPAAEEIELCQYNGNVREIPNSWVAISTCNGLSGVIFDGNDMHYIEKDTKVLEDDIEASHLLFKNSDLIETNGTCESKGSTINYNHFHQYNKTQRYKRSTKGELPKVRMPYNSNQDSKYLELILVFDNRVFKFWDRRHSRVINHAKSIANIVNAIYSPLNIFIALVGVVTWTEHDEIEFVPDADKTLSNFLHYRKDKLIRKHRNDNAQLVTKYIFDKCLVGRALKGPICTYEYSGAITSDMYTTTGQVATVVAHQLGHNFGMEHDTLDCECSQEECLMSPRGFVMKPTGDLWSSCSKNYLLNSINHGMDYCLRNKPSILNESPTCGNGFVEPGEECDCGLPEYCDNYCCNPLTCTLYNNATCATGECCNLTTCQPKDTGILCRSIYSECDLPEYCDGQSEYCPIDTYKQNGDTCLGGNAYCYDKICKTRNNQCKLLWGLSGKDAHEKCYRLNTKGNRHGHCGYDLLNHTYQRCEPEDVFCGLLQCSHLNDELEFGMESVSILSHTYINNKGTIIPCRTASIDLGVDEMDQGLSPNGAICGEGKMCVNQKCVTVSTFKQKGPSCPQNCNGHGWCNNRGNCHCENGFAPPDCIHPGTGGSIESGSPTKLKAENNNETISEGKVEENKTSECLSACNSTDELKYIEPQILPTATNIDNKLMSNNKQEELKSEGTTELPRS